MVCRNFGEKNVKLLLVYFLALPIECVLFVCNATSLLKSSDSRVSLPNTNFDASERNVRIVFEKQVVRLDTEPRVRLG